MIEILQDSVVTQTIYILKFQISYDVRL